MSKRARKEEKTTRVRRADIRVRESIIFGLFDNSKFFVLWSCLGVHLGNAPVGGATRFAIYAKKTVLTLLAPKPKRQPPSLRYGGPGRAGALQKLRHVVAP
ncbi:MAG TPA: hypothetical protein VNH84_21900, partial [Candidatus Saccharimonadales bacterium]|nr:hypothetical protein [Candidatus Saccharimonadales bacterium]